MSINTIWGAVQTQAISNVTQGSQQSSTPITVSSLTGNKDDVAFAVSYTPASGTGTVTILVRTSLGPSNLQDGDGDTHWIPVRVEDMGGAANAKRTPQISLKNVQGELPESFEVRIRNNSGGDLSSVTLEYRTVTKADAA